jgi:hypothetical protein
MQKLATLTADGCLFFLNNQQDTLIIQIYFVIKHPDSAWKQSSKTYIKLTSAKCTVEDS